MVTLGLVVAEFNAPITEQMEDVGARGCRRARCGNRRNATRPRRVRFAARGGPPRPPGRHRRRRGPRCRSSPATPTTTTLSRRNAQKLTDVSLTGTRRSHSASPGRACPRPKHASVPLRCTERSRCTRLSGGTTMMDFSDRIRRVEPSATLAISNPAYGTEGRGPGRRRPRGRRTRLPDARERRRGRETAMDAGTPATRPSKGVPELREAIAEKLQGDGHRVRAETSSSRRARNRRSTRPSRRSSTTATRSSSSTPRGSPTRRW